MKTRNLIWLVVPAVMLAGAAIAYSLAGRTNPQPDAAAPIAPSVETTSFVMGATAETGSAASTAVAQAPGAKQGSPRTPGATARDAAAASTSAVTPGKGGENRFGLTTEKRKACYWEGVQAEDRAVAEAEAAYPLDSEHKDADKHLALRASLMEKYKTVVAQKYGITLSQLEKVMEEGVQKHWPMPPFES